VTEASAARGARELFGARFGRAVDGVWLAPGRANLMGEHTDYNDGYVLPFALGEGVAVAAARRAGGRLALCSRQQPDRVAEIDLGLACRAENEFVGVPCGIMDQSASLLARPGHAVLLDCRSRASSQIPFDPARGGSRLLLIDTRAVHQLTAGEYGRRRAECEQAARLLGIPSLRYLTDCGDSGGLPDPVLRRRARHVVTDNARALSAAALLRSAADDVYPGIGRLLTRAHRSLRDGFEVSWPEADVAVEAALDAGALGARMIGGGFGGSVLALVPERAEDAVRAAVAGAYAKRSWTEPGFLQAAPSAGARRL